MRVEFFFCVPFLGRKRKNNPNPFTRLLVNTLTPREGLLSRAPLPNGECGGVKRGRSPLLSPVATGETLHARTDAGVISHYTEGGGSRSLREA